MDKIGSLTGLNEAINELINRWRNENLEDTPNKANIVLLAKNSRLAPSVASSIHRLVLPDANVELVAGFINQDGEFSVLESNGSELFDYS
jgi:hypothetical protein